MPTRPATLALFAVALAATTLTACCGVAAARKTKMEPLQALRSGDAKARCAAATALGARGGDEALAALVEALDGRDEVVRACVVAALRAQPAAVPFVLAEGKRRDASLRAAGPGQPGGGGNADEARQAATFALGQHLRRAGALQDARLLALVDLGLGQDQPRFVRSGAAWCLAGQRWDAAAAERWQRALADADKDVRWPAADGLVRAGRGADAAGRAAIAALATVRLQHEGDAGVRAKLEAAAK